MAERECRATGAGTSLSLPAIQLGIRSLLISVSGRRSLRSHGRGNSQ